MAVGDADMVRAYATRLVSDARSQGETRITFRAGDIHASLHMNNAHRNVCQVLDSGIFHGQAGVKLTDYDGPNSRQGSNARFTFEILPVGGATIVSDAASREVVQEAEVLVVEEDTANSETDNLLPARAENEDGSALSQIILERLRQLSPDQFEILVGEYMKAKGFSDVQVTGKSYDGGIDGHCGIPFINVKVAFQAKRYAANNSVGIEPVQRLQGSMSGGYDRGVFITTSSFTSTASGWVEEAQAQITLVDGAELVKQMIDMEIGVRAIPVVRRELDEGFFTDLESK